MDETLLHAEHGLNLLYREHSLLITDTSGWMTGGLHGLYERDLRILSRYRLWVNGHVPSISTFTLVDANSSLAFYIAASRPGSLKRDILGIPERESDRDLVLRVARSVGSGLAEEIEFSNHGPGTLHVALLVQVDADFADLVEARENRRLQTARISRRWEADGDGTCKLYVHYEHPQLDRGALIQVQGPPASAWDVHQDGKHVSCAFDLPPQRAYRIAVSIAPIVKEQIAPPTYQERIFARSVSATDRAREQCMRDTTHM